MRRLAILVLGMVVLPAQTAFAAELGDLMDGSRDANYTAEQNLWDRLFGVANFSIETSAASVAPELELRGYSYQLRSFLTKMLDRIVSLG